MTKATPFTPAPRLRSQEALSDPELAAALVQGWAGLVDLESLIAEAEGE